MGGGAHGWKKLKGFRTEVCYKKEKIIIMKIQPEICVIDGGMQGRRKEWVDGWMHGREGFTPS